MHLALVALLVRALASAMGSAVKKLWVGAASTWRVVEAAFASGRVGMALMAGLGQVAWIGLRVGVGFVWVRRLPRAENFRSPSSV